LSNSRVVAKLELVPTANKRFQPTLLRWRSAGRLKRRPFAIANE